MRCLGKEKGRAARALRKRYYCCDHFTVACPQKDLVVSMFGIVNMLSMQFLCFLDRIHKPCVVPVFSILNVHPVVESILASNLIFGVTKVGCAHWDCSYDVDASEACDLAVRR